MDFKHSQFSSLYIVRSSRSTDNIPESIAMFFVPRRSVVYHYRIRIEFINSFEKKSEVQLLMLIWHKPHN